MRKHRLEHMIIFTPVVNVLPHGHAPQLQGGLLDLPDEKFRLNRRSGRRALLFVWATGLNGVRNNFWGGQRASNQPGISGKVARFVIDELLESLCFVLVFVETRLQNHHDEA